MHYLDAVPLAMVPPSHESLSAVVLTVKLERPPLPQRTLSRPHVLQRLAAWQHHRLTVVSGPAGFGKTTLAAHVLWNAEAQEERFLNAWLSLDEGDNSPGQFLAGLTTALARFNPATAAAAANAINQNRLQVALQRLLDGFAALQKPFLFVLDDFHYIRDLDTRQLFTQAVEYSPANLHWMLLSRHVTPIPLGKFRLQNKLLEITAADLRLRRDEVETFAGFFAELHLDSADVDLLEARTGGWIGGIQLTLLSLIHQRVRAPHSVQKLVAHVRGDNSILSEYLSSEVLARVDEDLRSFLVRCSILDRLHRDLCSLVTGKPHSAQLLERAASEQTFLRPLDPYGEWYEMHQMFREMLQRKLRTQLPAAELRALYRAAADWFLAKDDVAAALGYLLAGDAAELAGAVLETRTRPALLANRMADIQQWFRLLPAAQIEARPGLLLDRAWLATAIAPSEAEDFIATAARLLPARDDLLPRHRDELTALLALQRMLSDDQAGLYADIAAAVERMDRDSHLARGWAHWIAVLVGRTQASAAKSASHLDAAEADFAAADHTFGRLLVIAWRALNEMYRGNPAGVLAACQRGHEVITACSHPPLDEKEFFNALAGETLYWQNRTEEAIRYFEQALHDAKAYGNSLPILRATVCLQLARRAAGAKAIPTEAQLHEERVLWQAIEDNNYIGARATIVTWQIVRWIAFGFPARAWEAFRQLDITLETLPAGAPDFAWLALLTAYVTNGRQLQELTPHLEMLLQRSRNAESRYLSIRCQLLSVSQQHQLGNHYAARTLMRQALHDVEQTGYVRFVLDHRELIPVLKGVQTKYSQTLLTLMEQESCPSVANTLTTQESAVLSLLAQGAKIAHIAEQLVVTPGTVKWHLTNIYAKLGVKSQRQAREFALRNGLVAD